MVPFDPDRHVPVRVLAIAGSLRRRSFNAALIRAALELAPACLEFDVYEDLGTMPHYNEDVRGAGEPRPVRRLERRVERADAVLFATPEYNYGVPGALKDAIDWISRPPDRSPLLGKPVSVIGASSGPQGSVRAQHALRAILLETGSMVMGKPEVLVNLAHQRFDGDLRLVDEATRAQVAQHLRALAGWTRLHSGARTVPEAVEANPP
jgi:chromate reductase